jgi:isoleucyl-tRNA synthetase
LGKKYGALMKQIAARIVEFTQDEIAEVEKNGSYVFDIQGNNIEILSEDVEISTKDIPGWAIAQEGSITVALDTNITEELKSEGLARELVNRIQNLRKDMNFEVTDKIAIVLEKNDAVNSAILANKDYICSETLAISFEIVDAISAESVEVELLEGLFVKIMISK